MTQSDTSEIYCSLDLEFTGFDPEIDQILEVGLAFFKITSSGIEIVEEWGQVFKPSIEVHPKILGLTGISTEELNTAPDFSEFREFLQSKLGNVTLVGHNPIMDHKFLEQNGVKLSGKSIDTLELVQIILPTHHSYNLENLIHYFGIKHEEGQTSHRALADARCTIAVLENLIILYQQFPKKLKDELQLVLERFHFDWTELLHINLPNKIIQSNDSLALKHHTNLQPVSISDNLITFDAFAYEHEQRVAMGLQTHNKKIVLVVEDDNIVLKLWRLGLVHGVFSTDNTFSKSRFNQFLSSATTSEEFRFCLKIIVWLYSNWQTETVLDLNISFFGGQFKQYIVQGVAKKSDHQIQCLSYEVFNSSAFNFEGHELLICDIQKYEESLSSGLTERLSWFAVTYTLKSLYDPESGIGNLELKEEVVKAMSAVDLFFGLTLIELKSVSLKKTGSSNISTTELLTASDYAYQKIVKASQTLLLRLVELEKQSGDVNLKKVISKIEAFFSEQVNRVRWISFDDTNVIFNNRPLEISLIAHQLFSKFTAVKMTEYCSSPDLLFYYVERLGLNTEQSDIPSNLLPKKVKIKNNAKVESDEDLLYMCTGLALPMIVVFPSPASVKEFYNSHYIELKKGASLFAQGYSGGGNKMFRNFSIKENSILLATADFISKQKYKLSAETLLFKDFPNIDSNDPYQTALINNYKRHLPHLAELLSLAKVFSTFKKLKLEKTTSIILFGFPNDVIVDKYD